MSFFPELKPSASVRVSPMAPELIPLAAANRSHDPPAGVGAAANGSHDPPAGVGAASVNKYRQPLLKPESDSTTHLPSESIQEMEKKYAAYVRKDDYGTMGRGELPVKEKVMLGFALAILVPVRVVVGLLILVVYYLICRLCTLFLAPNREDGQEDYAHMVGWRRKVVVGSGRFLTRAMLFNFGFYWIRETRWKSSDEVECREQSDEPETPGVIVSNHVSHLDILYHMSSSFPSFVAKRSVAKLPLVGIISKCLGCVYVQRESKSSESKGVSGVVTERIQEAHQNRHFPMMMLFPEGTTTNGDYLLPFKTGAFLAKVRHVLLLLCQFVNHLDVTYLPVYYPSEEEKENPKLYASNVRKLLATEGNLTLSEIGLAEKRVYHAALNGNSRPRVFHQKDD